MDAACPLADRPLFFMQEENIDTDSISRRL